MWKFATLVIFNFEFANVGNRENNVSNKTVDKKLIKKSLTLKTKYNFCAANKTHLKVSPLKFKLRFKIYLNSVLQNMQKILSESQNLLKHCEPHYRKMEKFSWKSYGLQVSHLMLLSVLF